MQQISISDIQRNLHKLKDFDIVEVVDKKRDEVKGYFVDSRYAQFIQELLEQQKHSKQIANKIAGSLKKYANPALIEEEKSAWKKQIKEKHQK